MTGPQPDTFYSDIADWLASQALDAVSTACENAKAEVPGHVFRIHGVGPPIQDPCDGLLWARVATSYPSDGSGQPVVVSRIDFGAAAWAHAIDVGILWCRENIDEEGAAVNFGYECDIATRDAAYRMCLLDGVANILPTLIRDCAMGIRMSPWTPIGPGGGWSGGLVNAVIITSGLSVTGL